MHTHAHCNAHPKTRQDKTMHTPQAILIELLETEEAANRDSNVHVVYYAQVFYCTYHYLARAIRVKVYVWPTATATSTSSTTRR